MTPFLLGVLGGMGPLATVDFMTKLLDATPAQRDQQQIPVLAWNVPQIADRQQALAGTGPSPLPQLLNGIKTLNAAGASHIAIPCNTAHHWFDALQAASAAPLVHIVEATLTQIRSEHATCVGVIATKGTLDAGWYQQGLCRLGITAVVPEAHELENLFVPGCYAVKRGALHEGGELLARQAQALVEHGAQRLILACTEVPVALKAIDSPFLSHAIDPAQALAERCSSLWQDYRHSCCE